MANYATVLFSGTQAGAASAQAGTAKATERDAVSGVLFQLDVTAAATLVGDTLDVKVQSTVDGTNWFDVCYFTQVLGNGGVKTFAAKISATEPQALFPTTTALTAGNIRHAIGTQFRSIYTTVGTGSFTFSVTMTVQ